MRPYDATDDPELWRTAYRWAERAASAGLGVTVHVGVFATTSIAAALRTPGLRRIGHGTHVADDPHLLDDLARSGVTLECSRGASDPSSDSAEFGFARRDRLRRTLPRQRAVHRRPARGGR